MMYRSDPVQRTNQAVPTRNRCQFLESIFRNQLFEISSNLFFSSSSDAYCSFEQSAETSKRLLLFYKPFVAQQSAGSIHTVSGNCWHACTDPWIPRTTGHTAPTQADRLWAISGVLPYLCSSEHRSCRSGTAEQRRTPRALRIQHLDLD